MFPGACLVPLNCSLGAVGWSSSLGVCVNGPVGCGSSRAVGARVVPPAASPPLTKSGWERGGDGGNSDPTCYDSPSFQRAGGDEVWPVLRFMLFAEAREGRSGGSKLAFAL